MKILAIETSCDDTCAAVIEDGRVLSNVISSQTNLHKEWGGVVPDIAKRAHQEKIIPVILTALRKFNHPPTPSLRKEEELIGYYLKMVDVIAVTKGPGLAIALSVGVNYAKELARKYNKRLVAINHVEGHLLSNWAKNRNGKPVRSIELPALGLTVSGGHTKLVLIKNKANKKYFDFEVVGETLDDAAGEALDKAAKQMGLGYPGGAIIERLATTGDINFLKLPSPLADKKILDYSFSGLKTAFYYQIKKMDQEYILKNLNNLAASYQNAVFESLIRKFKLAIIKYQPKTLLASGGVLSNMELRKRLRKLAKEMSLKIYFPEKKMNTDNAAMIGIAGYFKTLDNEYSEVDKIDVEARAEVGS